VPGSVGADQKQASSLIEMAEEGTGSSGDRPTMRIEGLRMGRWRRTWWMDGWMDGWVYNLFTTVDTINREEYRVGSD
jgi:hypothetical protein